MGLLRDTFSGGNGGGHANTGFNGPTNFLNRFSGNTAPSGRYSNPNSDPQQYQQASYQQPGPPQMSVNNYDSSYQNAPPAYSNYGQSGPSNSGQYDPYGPGASPSLQNGPPRLPHHAHHGATMPNFRPLALPQTDYGDGMPFLRGYSQELSAYGISEGTFIRVVDDINVAIVPNPEAQVYTKLASVAKHFAPGIGHIALGVTKAGVGMGAKFGNASTISKALSQANLEVFLPKGLEICIGKSADVAAETGSGSAQPASTFGTRPEDRIAMWGNSVASLTQVLPTLQNAGRQDGIAQMSQRMSSRENGRKLRRAEKQNDRRGHSRQGDNLESHLQWLIVRRASPQSSSHWQQTLHESNAAIEQEQRQYQQQQQGPQY